jgi:hypothetical protein
MTAQSVPAAPAAPADLTAPSTLAAASWRIPRA